MHRPMLRALKLTTKFGFNDFTESDASPDVEGIETSPVLIGIHKKPKSDASPDVEGIETI